MMTRKDRAKQFMPFDAMKGLQEALRDREERHSRVARHENSEVIMQLEKRSRVAMDFYRAFHDIHEEGVITEISLAYRYLKLNNEKIYFDDIYRIEVTDIELGTNREKEQAAFF